MSRNYLQSHQFDVDDAKAQERLDSLLAAQPCRQETQQCDHNGDCLRCGAWTGELCRKDRRVALPVRETEVVRRARRQAAERKGPTDGRT